MEEKTIIIERQTHYNSDWEVLKEIKYNKRNLESARRQAKKLIQKEENYQIHVVALGPDDPYFQEFYYDDGGVKRLF